MVECQEISYLCRKAVALQSEDDKNICSVAKAPLRDHLSTSDLDYRLLQMSSELVALLSCTHKPDVGVKCLVTSL
jgi:hypothetical protein